MGRKKPENDGKQESESWDQITYGWWKCGRAVTDACVAHDLRWTPANAIQAHQTKKNKK